MTQTARITAYTVLISISVALFGNGMIIHEAKASAMDHSSAMNTSSNTLCQATSCVQKHFTCENHCVSLPIIPEQQTATISTQINFQQADISSAPTILIRGPTKNKPQQILKTSSAISQIRTVIKRE
ncbi:hypothetical protein HYV69_03150 [Candidatus Uhrbacteria bacterium]|nr:hypothetical protein [Candidatus Uhrbacteria bacterium]